MDFQCRSTDRGTLDFGYSKPQLLQYLKENPGTPFILKPILPESRKARGYLEGGLIPLVAFYQEGMDHRKSHDLDTVREWLKEEHNGQMVIIAGVGHVVGRSTKGRDQLNSFIERVLAWIMENYAPPQEAIDTKSYKHWRDTIFPYGGPSNFIDYLISINVLKI